MELKLAHSYLIYRFMKILRYKDISLIYENVKQAKSILIKNGIKDSDPNYLMIRDMLKGHDGYVGMFTNLLYNKGYSIDDLSDLYRYITDNNIYIQNLDKNIVEYDNIENIQDDVEKIKLSSGIRKVYQLFPSKQKEMVDKIPTNKRNILLKKLYDRKDNKAFFKKISSYNKKEDLLSGLELFLSIDPNAKMDSIIDACEKNGSKIVHKSFENSILIVEVFNVNQLNNIAGDCSWCIKNEGTFGSYVNNTSNKTSQYVIFLFDIFDNYSKIGATFNYSTKSGLHTAHNKVDSRVDYDMLSNILKDHNYNIDNLKVKIEANDFNRFPVSVLLDEFTKEQIVKNKTIFRAGDIKLFTKDEIDEYNLLDKSEIDVNTLDKYTFEEIKSKKLLARVNMMLISSIVVYYGKFGIEWINYIKDNGYISCLGISERNFVDDLKLPSTNDWGINEDRFRTDYFKTMFRFIWFLDSFKKMIKNVKHNTGYYHRELTEGDPIPVDNRLISALKESLSIESIKLFNDLGYKMSNYEAYEYILDNIGGSFPKKIENIIEYCKTESIDYSKYTDMIFDNIVKNKIRTSEFSDVKRYLSGYKLEKSESIIKNREFNNELGNSNPYSKVDPEKFYSRWGEYVKTFDKIEYPASSFDHFSLNISLIYLRLDKLDEISNKLKFSRSDIKNIDKIISDTYITNGGIRDRKLTIDQREKLYKWIITQDLDNLIHQKYSIKGETKNIKEFQDKRHFYTRSIFLFDKKSYKEYLNFVKNLKYNVSKSSFYSTGVEPKLFIRSGGNSTNRIEEIYDFLRFLNEKYKDDFKKLILDILSDWKLMISEIKYILDYVIYDRYPEIKKLLIDKLIEKGASKNTLKKYE